MTESESKTSFGVNVPRAIASNISGLTDVSDPKKIMMFSDMDLEEAQMFSRNYAIFEFGKMDLMMKIVEYELIMRASVGRAREKVVGEIGVSKLVDIIEEEEKEKGFRDSVNKLLGAGR